jgi:hypothetical protein
MYASKYITTEAVLVNIRLGSNRLIFPGFRFL